MSLEHAKPPRPFQDENQQQEPLNELQRHCWEHTLAPLLQPPITSNHQGHVTCPPKTTSPNSALSFPGTPLPHPQPFPTGSLSLGLALAVRGTKG